MLSSHLFHKEQGHIIDLYECTSPTYTLTHALCCFQNVSYDQAQNVVVCCGLDTDQEL